MNYELIQSEVNLISEDLDCPKSLIFWKDYLNDQITQLKDVIHNWTPGQYLDALKHRKQRLKELEHYLESL